MTNFATINCLQGPHLHTDMHSRVVIKSRGCSVVVFRASYKYVPRVKRYDPGYYPPTGPLTYLLLCWCRQKLLIETQWTDFLIFLLFVYHDFSVPYHVLHYSNNTVTEFLFSACTLIRSFTQFTGLCIA